VGFRKPHPTSPRGGVKRKKTDWQFVNPFFVLGYGLSKVRDFG